MIAQTIQLALAPVFVLVAIGNLLNLLSSRLGRAADVGARAVPARLASRPSSCVSRGFLELDREI